MSRPRHDRVRMEIVENAATSVIAAAAAVESSILTPGLFFYDMIRFLLPKDVGKDFAAFFLQKYKRGSDIIPGGTYAIKPAWNLHKFARTLTGSLNATPSWPRDSYDIAKRRNALLHESVSLTESRSLEEGVETRSAIRLLEDEPAEELVIEAQRLFGLMLECLRCLEDAHRRHMEVHERRSRAREAGDPSELNEADWKHKQMLTEVARAFALL